MTKTTLKSGISPSFGEWMSTSRPRTWVRGKKWQIIPNTWPTALMVTAQKHQKFDLYAYGDAVFLTLFDQYDSDHPHDF
jgi:hypothetical protein